MKLSRLICTLVAGSLLAMKASAGNCEAGCMRSQIDAYLAALIERDPAILKLSPHVRFTENGKAGAPGDGLWSSATSLGDYRQYLEDRISQQAVFIGIVNEGDGPAILALRLGMSDGEIAEIEHIVARKGSHALFAPAARRAHPQPLSPEVSCS